MRKLFLPAIAAALLITGAASAQPVATQSGESPAQLLARGGHHAHGDHAAHGDHHGHAHHDGHAHHHGHAQHDGHAHRGRRADVFARIDTDRDGAISREELSAMQQRRLQMFERADANRDGKVTREEMHAMRQAMRDHKRERMHEPMRPRNPASVPATPFGPDPQIYHLG